MGEKTIPVVAIDAHLQLHLRDTFDVLKLLMPGSTIVDVVVPDYGVVTFTRTQALDVLLHNNSNLFTDNASSADNTPPASDSDGGTELDSTPRKQPKRRLPVSRKDR